jgi:hypothetical protein
MGTYRLKGASGAVINQDFALGAKTVIGSAEDCDLRVESDGVEPRHAEITGEQDALLLKNLASQAETLLNGEAVDQASLASGDEIRIANCRWVLQAPGLRPQKVLTGIALRPRRSYLPWLIVGGLLAAAVLSWQSGWLPF